MLNSNYFSKRHFQLNIEALNIWLNQQYGISFSNTNTIDKQLNYYNSYIKFLNYREKYIQQHKSKATNKVHHQGDIIKIERLLLDAFNIQSYTNYTK